MEKHFYEVAVFGGCPKCPAQIFNVFYVAVTQKAEIGAAKRSGVFTYKCGQCGTEVSSSKVMFNGEVREVSEGEAVSHGLAFTSSGQA